MELKKHIIWLVVLLNIITVNGSFAQSGVKYPYVEERKIIVNRDVQGGVKESMLHRKWDSSNPMPAHDEQSAANAVSAKFEVATTDCNSNNAPGVTVLAGNKYTYANAANVCVAYSQDDILARSWRLPTQRELMLICIFKDELGDFTSRNYYWSATISKGTNYTWIVGFNNGNTDHASRDNAYTVRCVRDL
ncbi:DUF1566 domain-containing protein [Parabacteroides faecis]|uniref:Lcl C-terminal domain-containing protein n=1 Tax=Parabacteroides faecis TaxID=1217282 RepID=UPI00216427EB|nr:DUF1566 domain-containing protein [Parabacteroides faecis]MCS2893545.1 DUF1566 domain-containing protein [Parabacteroides faecis]UVQ47859.1 DUF1566 domain-containing protein [Parabacteroides faecis]